LTADGFLFYKNLDMSAAHEKHENEINRLSAGPGPFLCLCSTVCVALSVKPGPALSKVRAGKEPPCKKTSITRRPPK